MNEKSSEECQAEQLVKWEVVCISMMGTTAAGYRRPQTLGPVKTKNFTQGRVTAAVSLKKQEQAGGRWSNAGPCVLNIVQTRKERLRLRYSY